MFKGRVDRVSHEGGLLVSYSGACPALGSVMVDSSETYIGKVDGVIGNLNDSLVHIAHLDRNSNATELVGIEITIRSRKPREKRQSNDDRRGRDDRHGRDDRKGRDDRREGYDRRGNSNHQKQDWDCPKCNNSNFSFRTECNRCGEEKGRGGSSSQRNDRRGGDDRRGRDDRRGGGDRRGGRDDRRGNSNHQNQDWDCPKCSNSNFAFRTECNRCGEEKGGRGSSSQRNDRRGRDNRGRENRSRGDGRQDNRGNHSDNDWECKECNNSNFSFRKECNRCGEPKGRVRNQSSTRWEGNDRRAGERKDPPQPRAGDWDCPQCGKSNFAKRNDCFSCGRSKRVGGPKDRGHHRKLRDPPPLQSAKYGRGNRRRRE